MTKYDRTGLGASGDFTSTPERGVGRGPIVGCNQWVEDPNEERLFETVSSFLKKLLEEGYTEITIYYDKRLRITIDSYKDYDGS